MQSETRDHQPREAREFDDVLEMLHGHWDCFDAVVRGEELHALELALRHDPRREERR